MKKPSDSGKTQQDLWEKLIGLGERSVRKSYYPELQERLEELERFRALLDNSNDLIFTLEVPSGKIIDVSQSVCLRTGYNRQDLLDRTIFECLDEACAGRLQRFFTLPHQSSPKRQLFECSLKTSEGVSLPLEVTLNRMIFGEGEYVAAIARDIMERKKAEESLQSALINAEEAREKIETILKSVADGLLFTDMDNRVVMMSAAAETLLGRKLPDFVMQPLERVIDNRELGKHIAAVKADGGNQPVIELELPANHQGRTRTVQVKSSLVRGKSGRKTGVITLLRDVSRERELDRIKSEFISTAAHELRTPLTSVRGYSQLLLNGEGFDPGQQREFLAIINEKTVVLEKIIDDLLDLSRVETGRAIHLKKDRHDLRRILSELVEQYRQGCPGHHFEATLPENPVVLSADKRKIVQVMENLLSNAVKFSPAGSKVRVTCEAAETSVMISVSDDGIGMTPEQLEQIFEKFYRVDASSTAVAGLGIGMAIAKGIVEAHEGSIRVKSALGQGTTVSFTLPLGGNFGDNQ